MPSLRIALVVPFLNEERYLPEMLESLAAQTRLPDRLLLIDDGSGDGSPATAAEFAGQHPWAGALRRPPHDVGADRLAGGAAVRAFSWGVEQLGDDWDVVAKIDSDLRLTPRFLEAVESALLADPKLGMTGAYLRTLDGDGGSIRQRCRPEHVEGETKFYRRACYEEIAPIPAMLGWDTIDEVRARLRGWRTASIEVPGGDPVHMREMGAHDGFLRGYRRWGRCAYAFGEHPLHALAVGVQRLGDRPRILGGVNYVIGFAGAALRRSPRAESAVRREVRRDELRRLGRRALRGLLPTRELRGRCS
jgi:biofilm PGA synthesis N-glycosyltransferase PgaC